MTTFSTANSQPLQSAASNLAIDIHLQARMKLQPDKSSGLIINGHGPGWVEVNGQRHTHSLTVSSLPDAKPMPWRPDSFEDLGAIDFESLLVKGLELVIFGSGQRLRFVSPQWLQSFMAQGIGVETMDTAAACRTYNILAGEGRKVMTALLIEP